MSKTPLPTRRRLIRGMGALTAGLAGIGLPVLAAPKPGIETVDALGRRISLPAPPRRIVLLEAGDILSMSMLEAHPGERIVGWAAPARIDSAWLRRTHDHGIAIVGGLTPDTLSHEAILALAPDLVVGTAFMLPGRADDMLTRRLERAGIPVAFSGARSNAGARPGSRKADTDTMEHAMRFWGAVLGQQEKAERFIAFCAGQRAGVAARLARARAAPVKTYLENVSTYDDCCWAAGTEIWGELLRMAGGTGLDAAGRNPWYTRLSEEQLINEQPQVYIATGGDFGSKTRMSIGPGLDAQAARQGLMRLAGRPGLDALPAVAHGRVFGIWTGLITSSALNSLFVEVTAKWLHPDLFHDVDPAASLAALNAAFPSQPLPGPLWVSLRG